VVTIHKAKDNSFKVIFNEPELFVEFLRDFIKIDILNDVMPSDIEDITERFLPLFQDSKDSDTVKKINLKGDEPIFIITILEHESQVNFRTSFKMLQYITLVLTDYEKETNKDNSNASSAKDFRYPPVLPIVFFDGTDKWTAETNFINKTKLNEVFHKYIPKFEYELVDLNGYGEQDLVRFGDALSLVMIIDKIKTADGISLLSNISPDYIEKLKQNIPGHLYKLLADVITLLLKRINVPDDEIDNVAEQLYQRRFQEMFTMIEKYDVQETRRIEREKGREEGREENAKAIVLEMKRENFSDEVIARITKVPINKIKDILD
jgi:hypothetical protein